MILPHLRTMFDYNNWANRRALASVTPDNDAAMRLLGHLVAAEDVWMRRMQGESQPDVEIFPTMTHDAIGAAFDDLRSRWAALLDTLDEAALAEVHSYHRSNGEARSARLLDVLQHVLNHASYHRGQIANAVRQAGGTPASVDFQLYVYAQQQ